MKKLAVIGLAIAVFMSANVWSVAATENRCIEFQDAVWNMWFGQQKDVAEGETFDPAAISMFVLAHIRT